jgi:GT2 family glycosyltransferase
VVAVVVTFDAPDAAAQCVAALEAQTRPPMGIVVVDNHGARPVDPEVLRALTTVPVDVLRTDDNLGPAGGYAVGLRRAIETDAHHYWLMDDDVHPDPGCLEALLAAASDRPSAVLGPAVVDAESGERADGWGWWGVLVPREAVLTVGFPQEDLFWGLEDQEYLRDRLPLAGYPLSRTEGAIVTVNRRADWRDEDSVQGLSFQRDKPAWKYYYEVRNLVYRYLWDRPHIQRSVRLKSLGAGLIGYARMVRAPQPRRGEKVSAVLRGAMDGVGRRLGRRMVPDVSDRPVGP